MQFSWNDLFFRKTWIGRKQGSLPVINFQRKILTKILGYCICADIKIIFITCFFLRLYFQRIITVKANMKYKKQTWTNVWKRVDHIFFIITSQNPVLLHDTCKINNWGDGSLTCQLAREVDGIDDFFIPQLPNLKPTIVLVK